MRTLLFLSLVLMSVGACPEIKSRLWAKSSTTSFVTEPWILVRYLMHRLRIFMTKGSLVYFHDEPRT